MTNLARVKGRALIGAAIIADAVDALRQPAPHEAVAEPLAAKIGQLSDFKPTAGQLVKGTAITQAVGGALIATSILPRLGALASLTASVPAALFGYRFWQVEDDDAHRAHLRQGFFAHLALAGAAILILAGPTRSGASRRARRKQAALEAKAK
jgi:uncharacterized membrane protein YphA (DoxX/SURF4 family)